MVQSQPPAESLSSHNVDPAVAEATRVLAMRITNVMRSPYARNTIMADWTNVDEETFAALPQDTPMGHHRAWQYMQEGRLPTAARLDVFTFRPAARETVRQRPDLTPLPDAQLFYSFADHEVDFSAILRLEGDKTLVESSFMYREVPTVEARRHRFDYVETTAGLGLIIDDCEASLKFDGPGAVDNASMLLPAEVPVIRDVSEALRLLAPSENLPPYPLPRV